MQRFGMTVDPKLFLKQTPLMSRYTHDLDLRVSAGVVESMLNTDEMKKLCHC